MENETVDFQPGQGEASRPAFLTVLCILTFLASAYYFFTSLVGIFISKDFDTNEWDTLSEQVAESMSDADETTSQMMQSAMEALAETTAKTIENATVLGLITMLVAVLSAFGAYEMYKLNRRGFGIYAAAKFIGIVVPLVILGANMVTLIGYTVALIAGLIMLFLYSINRKYMH